MAFVDSRGLIGRPGLRRALSGLDRQQEQEFGALTADIDPVRFRSLYKQRAEQFLNEERAMAANRAPGLAEQRRQRMAQSINDRNFRAGDTGAVDYELEDAQRDFRRNSLIRGF